MSITLRLSAPFDHITTTWLLKTGSDSQIKDDEYAVYHYLRSWIIRLKNYLKLLITPDLMIIRSMTIEVGPNLDQWRLVKFNGYNQAIDNNLALALYDTIYHEDVIENQINFRGYWHGQGKHVDSDLIEASRVDYLELLKVRQMAACTDIRRQLYNWQQQILNSSLEQRAIVSSIILCYRRNKGYSLEQVDTGDSVNIAASFDLNNVKLAWLKLMAELLDFQFQYSDGYYQLTHKTTKAQSSFLQEATHEMGRIIVYFLSDPRPDSKQIQLVVHSINMLNRQLVDLLPGYDGQQLNQIVNNLTI